MHVGGRSTDRHARALNLQQPVMALDDLSELDPATVLVTVAGDADTVAPWCATFDRPPHSVGA